MIIEKFFRDTSFVYSVYNNNNNTLSKQYVAPGEKTDFVGGLGSFIDYEKSKYLKDKSGKLLPPSEQKLFRRLKKNYAQFLRIKNHETEYRTSMYYCENCDQIQSIKFMTIHHYEYD